MFSLISVFMQMTSSNTIKIINILYLPVDHCIICTELWEISNFQTFLFEQTVDVEIDRIFRIKQKKSYK